MRIRVLLIAFGMLTGLVAVAPPAVGQEVKEAACAKDPQGDESGPDWKSADYPPVDLLNECYRYTPEGLVLEVNVAKPLDPLKAEAWKDGVLRFEIGPMNEPSENWFENSPIEVRYGVSNGKLVVVARPVVTHVDDDWSCFGTATTTASGYRALLPWDCVRVEGELYFSYTLFLNGGYSDSNDAWVCCGPNPPEPAPARPAVTVRDADSACPPGRVPEDGLTDADGSVHEPAIDCTMWWGVTTRTSAGRFSPRGEVTRGLMAEWIARFLDRTGGQLPDSAEDQFSDVATSPFRDNINRIGAAGVVGGYPDGTFRPGEPVTRAQMATFVAAAHRFASGQVLGTNDTDWFADDETSVHQESINRIASVGVAGGTSQGVYSPGAAITRGQMASFLARLLDVAVDAGRATPPS